MFNIRKNKFKKNLNRDITPDEIFLDSSNLSEFDTEQFEGWIEKPISKKAMSVLFFSFIFLAIMFSSRIWFIQIKEGQAYLDRSENNRLRESYLFSNRGVIYDRNGEELVYNIVHPGKEDFSKRKYPDIPGFSHILGYIKYPTKDKGGFYWETSFIGKDGVENFYNDLLVGRNGREIIEIDALGDIYSQSITEDSIDGENLHLSIDYKLQNKFFEIIAKTSEQFEFQGGGGAIIDVKSGEIISLVSFPEYGSSILSDGTDSSAINKFITDTQNPFLNRVISGLYVPGSIIKPFVAVGALNEELIDPQKKILSTGFMTVPNPYFPDKPSVFTDWKAHGWVDLIDALAISSNIYFYHIGGGFGDQKGLGINKIEKYFKLFGLGDKTGIDLPGEVAGVIPNPQWKKDTFQGDDWRLGDTYNTSIGQYGLQLTPIQVLKSMATLANGGYILEPTILKGGKDQKVNKISVKKEAIDLVNLGMRQAVERGTAGGLNVSYVNVAAKTGTAEIGKQSLNSWVTGFFPYENPKYAFVVIMERGPRHNTTGGVYVMRNLLDWMNQNTPEYLK